jgi:alpha-1,4-digalacturonate transport system permease protein
MEETMSETGTTGAGMPSRKRFSLRDLLGQAFSGMVSLLVSAVDLVMTPIQKGIGIPRMPYIFLLPNMLIFGIFVLTPMLMNFYYSMTGGTELFLKDRAFVGLNNFRYLFDCQNFLDPSTCDEDLFWRAIWNTTLFVVLQVGGMVLFAMATATILNREIRGRGFWRSVFFYPVLLSPVVVALIWKWILQRDGVLNAIIMALGGERIPFLLDPTWAIFWVILVSIWAQMGFHTLILLAGLQAIPAELYEAGAIDGTSRWQAFRHITLPLWMPSLFVVLVLSLIRAVQVFDQVYVLTRGGPGTATQYVVQYIYNTGFANMPARRGLAAAASLVMGAILLVLTLIQLRLGRETEAA